MIVVVIGIKPVFAISGHARVGNPWGLPCNMTAHCVAVESATVLGVVVRALDIAAYVSHGVLLMYFLKVTQPFTVGDMNGDGHLVILNIITGIPPSLSGTMRG